MPPFSQGLLLHESVIIIFKVNMAIFIFIIKMFLYLLTSRKIYIAFNVLDIQLLFFFTINEIPDNQSRTIQDNL